MAGHSPAARDLADRIAYSYLAALGYAAAPGDAIAEPFARMFFPAAQAITETQAMAEELGARLDAYAGALAEVLLRDAEERGDLDAMTWPDVELSAERCPQRPVRRHGSGWRPSLTPLPARRLPGSARRP